MSGTIRVVSLLLAAGLALLGWPADAQYSGRTAGGAATAMRNASRIETEFRRGVTTREDVRRLLGEPTGSGGAFFPTATKANDVWAYENVEMELVGSTREPTPAIQARQRWDVVLIFFDGNLYTGFMWYTSGGEATGAMR